MLLLLVVPGAAAQEAPVVSEIVFQHPERCDKLKEEQRRQTEECKTPEEREEDEREARIKAQAEKEKAHHSSFLKWLHMDAAWVPTQSGVGSFGLIGAHLAVANIGRVYVYGPPGVMMLIEDTGHGHEIRPALTWGVSVYLTEFRVPGVRRPAQLFLNVSKCWTRGAYMTGLNMGGFSMTWKKPPPDKR